MGCDTCKQKSKIKEDIIKSSEFVGKGVVWFTIIWSALAIYGLFSIITKIL